ncbi:MAG: hypothetical protein M1819_007473 [Sarea resinae]|nr:MAG: hypothetical protein M1819_007473 [Sarea resinae]
MLSESLVTATLSAPNQKSSRTSITKDASIQIHSLHPSPTLKQTFKKSSTNANSAVINATHIFAAQADKAVVHVYNRERGNQESTIAFPERIRSLALAGSYDGAGFLVLGTEGGRIIVWELQTGRQVSSPPSHLQPTTHLAISPSNNYLLSGSADSNIHIWSLPSLLSFSKTSSGVNATSPIRTLSSHRAPITALSIGHSQGRTNIAISASNDATCIIWDYHSGDQLRTFLLPSTPLCLTLDPADRAFYAGYEDGSVQIIDFFSASQSTSSISSASSTTLDKPALQPISTLQQSSNTPLLPPPNTHFLPPSTTIGSTLSLVLSYDTTTLFTGHASGKLISWDVAKHRYVSEIADLASPITNLLSPPPTGFPSSNITATNTADQQVRVKAVAVVKPRYESSYSAPGVDGVSMDGGAGAAVPGNYTLNAQFTGALPSSKLSAANSYIPDSSVFTQTLANPAIPSSLLEEGLLELASCPVATTNTSTLNHASNGKDTKHDLLSSTRPLTDGPADADSLPSQPPAQSQEDEIAALRSALDYSRAVQKKAMEQLKVWGTERRAMRAEARKEREKLKRVMKRRDVGKRNGAQSSGSSSSSSSDDSDNDNDNKDEDEDSNDDDEDDDDEDDDEDEMDET